ncbi:hypothetical protein ACFXON_23740, partial [Bacillus subtilis]
ERAMCGRLVSVVLPTVFRGGGSEVCERCAREVSERRSDPVRWRERQSDRNRIRAQRREDQEVIDDYRRMQAQRALLAERQRLLGRSEGDEDNHHRI